jgi:hypothetical protein
MRWQLERLGPWIDRNDRKQSLAAMAAGFAPTGDVGTRQHLFPSEKRPGNRVVNQRDLAGQFEQNQPQRSQRERSKHG